MGNFIEEYNDLVGRVSALYDVAQDAGATAPMPAVRDTWHLSSYIQSIESTPIQDDWCLPYGWPDLRKVIDNDPFKDRQNVVGRMVSLHLVSNDNNLPCFKDADYGGTWGNYWRCGTGYNVAGWRTSNDPDTYHAFANYASDQPLPVVWDPSKYIAGANGERYVWVEIYYKTSYCEAQWTHTFFPGVLWVHGDGASSTTLSFRFTRSLKAVTGFAYGVVQGYDCECAQIETVPPLSTRTLSVNLQSTFDYTALRYVHFAENGQPLSATNYNYTFYSCPSLKAFPDILFEGNQLTGVYSVAGGCYSIREYPDVMDFSKVTYYPEQFWNHCNNLRQYIEKLPSRMIFPNVLSCQINQMGVVYQDTLARFTEDNELSGGWFYGWEKNPNSSSTLSVKIQSPGGLFNWMTQDQKNAVSSYLLNEKDIYMYY